MEILSLEISYFKGIKDLKIKFPIKSISGQNATGKTSVYDAVAFLLFGKDSSDSKDFDVFPKTLMNEFGVCNIEVSVSANFKNNNRTFSLMRGLREDINKDGYLTGYTTICSINGLADTKVGDYKKFVDSLVPIDIFKLLTNPLYFNSENFGWKQRCEILIKLAGEPTEQELISKNPDLSIFSEILKSASIDQFNKSIQAKIKKVKSEMELIPIRIDEVIKGMPQPLIWSGIEGLIATKKQAIEAIDAEISALNSGAETEQKTKNEIHKTIYEKQSQIQKEKSNLDMAKMQLANEIETLETKINNNNDQIIEINQDILFLTDERNNLLIKFKAAQSEIWQAPQRLLDQIIKLKSDLDINNYKLEILKSEQYKDSENCPTCGQKFTNEQLNNKIEHWQNDKTAKINTIAEKIQEIKDEIISKESEIVESQKDFSDNRVLKLNEINLKGQAIKGEIATKEKEISSINDANFKLNTQVATLKETKYDEFLINSLDTEITSLQNQITAIKLINVTDQNRYKQDLITEITILQKDLTNKEVIERAEIRIKGLETKRKDLAKELNLLEKDEYLCKSYNETLINIVSAKVNSLFSGFEVRMFKRLMNGEFEPCCDIIENGVRFSSINRANQINIGMQIISVLAKFYNFSAPIFVDNAECVNTLFDMREIQVIPLYVTNESKLTFN